MHAKTYAGNTAVQVTRLHKEVADSIRRTLSGYVGGTRQEAIWSGVHSTLQATRDAGVIEQFKVDSVRIRQVGPIREVHDLDPSALPGDPVYDDDGSFRGLVVSHDGDGHGVVFVSRVKPEEANVVEVKVSVQPLFPVQWISVDVKV